MVEDNLTAQIGAEKPDSSSGALAISGGQNKSSENGKILPKVAQSGDIEDSDAGLTQAQNNMFQLLFSNDNRLLTMEGGELVIDDETRRMLALFSEFAASAVNNARPSDKIFPSSFANP